MNKLTIKLNSAETLVTAGLTKATDFYEKLSIDSSANWLYLNQEGDIDIPLLPEDHLIIHGDEQIVVGEIDSNIGENPSLRKSIFPEFNGRKIESGFSTAKITSEKLMGMDADIQPNKLFADLKDQADAFIRTGLTIVVQDADAYFTIPLSGDNDDDAVDLEACTRANRKPPKGQDKYKIKIDGEKYIAVQQMVTGEEILALVGKNYTESSLNQKLGSGRRKMIEKDESVNLAEPGIERFETVPKQAQQG